MLAKSIQMTSKNPQTAHSFILSLSFPSSFSKRDSSMQAPSQNSPLCAYQSSGLAQSDSTANNNTPPKRYPLFSFVR